MRLRILTCSPPKKGIAKAPTILLTCGKSLTLVQIYYILLTPPMNFFCGENMEEEDSKEALEFDGDAYPILPDNVLELQIHCRKGILRQFMGATRRMCHQ